MEIKPDNAIDFKETTIEEAVAAGSPAEQPIMSQEQLDTKYAAPTPQEPKPEEKAQAEQLMESLQAAPEMKRVDESIGTEKKQEMPTMTPNQFVALHGGRVDGTERSVQGAADFLEDRRLSTSEKISMIALPAAGAALAGMVSSLSGATTLSALVAGGVLPVILGGVIPAAAIGAGVWFGYKGLRNIFAERSFKKTFGRTIAA